MWVYSHALFQRDRPHLLENLKRKTNGNSLKRLRETFEPEENLIEEVTSVFGEESEDSFDEFPRSSATHFAISKEYR